MSETRRLTRRPYFAAEVIPLVIAIACRTPIDFGYAAETWTYAQLTAHIHKTAEAAGYTRLFTIHKSAVHTILAGAEIKPHKITYYCENRDPHFDQKMHNVFLVYKLERIYQYFEEINGKPVVYHWKYKLDEINPTEQLLVETLLLE